MSKYNFDTEQIHGKIDGRCKTGNSGGSVEQTAAFEHATAEDLKDVFLQRKYGHIYSRICNPTVAKLEERLNILDDGVGCLALSSGMAAVSTALLTILKQGDELISGNSLFGGTYALFNEVFSRFGIKTYFVEASDVKAYEQAITPNTKAIFLESLANPKLDVPDLQAIADLAHANDIPLIVDNTVLSPYLLKAKDFGVDILVYSTTKVINGHGNAIGGAIIDCGTFSFFSDKYRDFDPYYEKFKCLGYLAKARKQIFINMGPCLEPQSAYLHLIGLETLSLRMDKHVSNALAVAEFLSSHPKVKKVNYPGLQGSLGYEVAQKQLKRGAGSLLTFELASQDEAFAFINKRSFSRNLANIGEAKTLLIHPASTIYLDYDADVMAQMGVNDRLVRVSVGIENEVDVIKEFKEALE